MSDGARNARLKDTRNGLIGRRLVHERRPRREDGVVDRRELVDAAADHPAELVAEEDLVLHVRAALVAVFRVRGNRDVEGVAAEVAAVAQRVLGADRVHVAGLDVECLGIEPERDRLAIRARA